jgi:hypothetical protein
MRKQPATFRITRLNHSVVTNEKPQPAAERTIKIPGARNGVGVDRVIAFQMLR